MSHGEVTDCGFHQKLLSSIKHDMADIAARMKKPHVVELAKSMKQTGRMAPPLVNEVSRDNFVLLAGRDRYAAMLINGDRQATFHIVKTDAKGARRIERHENLHRRPIDRDKLIAEEVEEEKKIILAAEAEAKKAEPKADKTSEESTGPGRPKGIDAKAREAVAKKLKTTPEAVRKATERAKAPAKKPAPAPKPAKAPLEAHGLTLPAAFIGEVLSVQGCVGTIDTQLRMAQAEVTRLGTKLGVDLAGIHKELHDIAARIRGMRPESVCLSCKDPDGKGGRRASCKACKGRGWVTASGSKDVPAELKATEKVSDGSGGLGVPPKNGEAKEKKLNIELG